MDIEKILPFIILGIYFLSLFGKKKKPQKEAPAKETTSLKNIIQGIAKQLKERIDSAARGLEQPDQEYRKSMKTGEPEVKPADGVRERKKNMDVPSLETLLDEEEAAGMEEGIKEEIEEALPKESKAASSVGKAHMKIKTNKARLPVNLQQAVIWLEILAPPVSLRDDRDRML